MCGIFGVIVKRESRLTFSEIEKIVNTLFKLSETRGKESSGISIKNTKSKKIYVYKESIPATKFVKSKNFKKYFSQSLTSCYKAGKVESPFALIAHTRLATNGSHENNNNNQPVIKDGGVMVHNGIVVNVEDLWKKYSFLKREFEVDTEILIALIRYYLQQGKSIQKAVAETYNEIYGSASLAMLMDNLDKVLIATNTGSLYWFTNPLNDTFIFASEKYILLSLIKEINLEDKLGKCEINWVTPKTGFVIDLNEFSFKKFSFETQDISAFNTEKSIKSVKDEIINFFNPMPHDNLNNGILLNSNEDERNKSLLEYNIDQINNLKRCKKCLLPETFPYISFDEHGVCNYCRNYKKIEFKGKDALLEYIEPFRSKNNKPDCIIAFSGGRDSSYGVHYVKEVLKLNPIAYTYDWGMVTDLARRNQARLCGKLGIEHIIVSADIAKKRSNIRKNVSAWLKKPNLGLIPLFMAGDKQYFYYANLLRKINNIDLVILCENMLETTNFKSGFCGIKPNFGSEHTYSLSLFQKAKMIGFYAKEYISNPKYLNSSIIDTAKAALSYYFIPHNYLNLFNYIEWDEKTIETTLFNEYDWEVSPDTPTTWRIGDGTASFYNYIYYTITGFSEFDTFRSNQIREGTLTRDKALKLVNSENKPRYESIKWYLDTIGLDFEKTIKTINKIPKLYNQKSKNK